MMGAGQAGGTKYINGWSYSGTPGTDGEATWNVPSSLKDNIIYFYCEIHSSMGSTIGAVKILDYYGELTIESSGDVNLKIDTSKIDTAGINLTGAQIEFTSLNESADINTSNNTLSDIIIDINFYHIIKI